jgi:uncharacterized protein (TIGR00661 family)
MGTVIGGGFVMTTIALSCAGEGFGHAARTAAIAQALQGTYRLLVLCPRHLFAFMREHVDRGTQLEEIPYFEFAKKRGRIDYSGTAMKNLGRLISFSAAASRTSRTLARYEVSALISDYDPFGPHAAKREGIPVFQINHPAVVLRQRASHPAAWLARILSVLLMGRYQERLVVSFYNGDVGPVIRPSISQQKTAREDFFVVYLKDSYREMMVRALQRLNIANYHVFPDPTKDIGQYLCRCKAVISSAGHQFMSEAIVLGKPVFVVPQNGQYEQQLNAEMLEASGWGTWAPPHSIDRKLARFFDSLDEYPLKPADTGVRFRCTNDLPIVVDRIEQFVHRTCLSVSPTRASGDTIRWSGSTRRIGARVGLSA